jgi:hypothetical protein
MSYDFRVGPGANSEHTGALMASALWLRLAFAGASGFAAGLALLFGGESSILFALGLAGGGSAVAVLAWRRAVAALDRIDATEGGEATAATIADTTAGRDARRTATIGPAARAVTLQTE